MGRSLTTTVADWPERQGATTQRVVETTQRVVGSFCAQDVTDRREQEMQQFLTQQVRGPHRVGTASAPRRHRVNAVRVLKLRPACMRVDSPQGCMRLLH